MKLKKAKVSEWLGNGFGYASAEWVVEGHEHIVLRNRGGVDWAAYDLRDGSAIVKPYGWKRSEVLEQVEEIIREAA